MELLEGIIVKEANSKNLLTANIYGQKQAGQVWNAFLVKKLREIDFTPSLVDNCVFYCSDIIFIVYVNVSITLGPNNSAISDANTELLNLKLDIEDQGHPADYVGVAIKRLRNRLLELSQHAALINTIIDNAKLTMPRSSKFLPKRSSSTSTPISTVDKPPYALDMSYYHSASGKLNYIGQTSRPKIMYGRRAPVSKVPC